MDFPQLHANPEERFEVSVKAGYDDTIRIYSKCPIYIEIENKEKTFGNSGSPNCRL